MPDNHSQSSERWNLYRDKRREYKKAINDAKTSSWQNFCTETDSLSATAKLHKLLCKDNTNKLTWLKNSAGEKSQGPAETLSILLDEHFAHSRTLNIDCSMSANDLMHNMKQLSNLELSLIDSIVTHEKIYFSLNSFSPFKSPGLDEIFPVVLQKSLHLIINTLQYMYLYYHSLRLSHIPEPWRHIKVIFIPKAGKRSYHDAKSFRPISLSSYFLREA